MNTALHQNHCRSVDDFATMYERVRVVQAHTSAERPSTSESSDTSDVTQAPSPASTPPSTAIDHPRDDCDRNHLDNSDDSDDWDDLGELKASDNPKRMADDFREGRLETIVGTPQKELPGTKDAYVSYQVTTKVGFPPQFTQRPEANMQILVRFPVFPTPRVLRPPPLHRLCLPLETALKRVPTMRRAAPTRQAQDGVRSRRPVRPGLYAQKSTLAAPIPQAHNSTPSAQTSITSNHVP